MSTNLLLKGLHGENAHVHPLTALEGLDWPLAGEKHGNSPYTIWELVSHLIFWQDFALAYLHGKTPKEPEHAKDSWPEKSKPSNEAEWHELVTEFRNGLRLAEQETNKALTEGSFQIGGQKVTRADLLSTIITHNSYHIGEIVLLRRQLGAWPPPSGGETW